MKSTILVCTACLLLSASVCADDLLHMSLGDSERKARAVPLVLDGVTDCTTGEVITPGELPARLGAVKLLFVGEAHTSMDFHRAQLRVIQALHDAGRRVMIGLEMYPYTEQRFLDQWGAGHLTEQGFVELSDWYDNWGYHWNYYREIFLYARQKGIEMFALNTPREIVKSVRTKGFENLTEEEAGRVPTQIDTDSDEHFRLFKAFFGEDGVPFHASMTEEQWRGMFNAQCAWDATMAYNAVRALRDRDSDEAIMVVLIGSGHVAYGLGIQRQAVQWFDGEMAAIVPIPVIDEKGDRVKTVQASYADFIWGLPPFVDELYPDLGISTLKVDESERRRVIHVAEDSVAQSAGFAIGDVLMTMNGSDLPDRRTLNRMMAGLRWGDSAVYEVDRGGERVALTAQFRRTRSGPCEVE
jgi:uncharacterized iron-regulated protein